MDNGTNISIKEVMERSASDYYTSFIRELEELKKSDGDPRRVMERVNEIREKHKADLDLVSRLRHYRMLDLGNIRYLNTLIQDISGAEKAKIERENRIKEAKEKLQPYEARFGGEWDIANIRGLRKLRKKLRKIECSPEEMIAERDALYDRIDETIKSVMRPRKNRLMQMADEYKRKELEFLTEDKNYIGAFFTAVGYRLGWVTVQKEVKKREQRIEESVAEYEQNGERLEADLNRVKGQIDQLRYKREDMLTQLELIGQHIIAARESLSGIDMKYKEKNSEPSSVDTEKTKKKLIEKGREEEKFIRKLEDDQKEYGHRIEVIRADIEAAGQECYNLDFRIKQNAQAKYDRIETLKNRIYSIVDPEELRNRAAIDAKAKTNEIVYNRSVRVVDGQGKGFMKNLADAYSQQERQERREREVDHKTQASIGKQMEAITAGEKALEERVKQYKGTLAQEPVV